MVHRYSPLRTLDRLDVTRAGEIIEIRGQVIDGTGWALRDALIDIAIDLIARDGVATFSIAEACRRLEVSPGAPYRHFSDREDLLTAVNEVLAVSDTHETEGK